MKIAVGLCPDLHELTGAADVAGVCLLAR